MTQWYMTALIIIVILAVFFLTVMIIDGNRFRVVEYQLYSSKVKKEHRYVVLSDLHNKSYGEKNSRLIRKIIGLTPEGILIAGDILTAKPGKSYEVALDSGQVLTSSKLWFAHLPQSRSLLASVRRWQMPRIARIQPRHSTLHVDYIQFRIDFIPSLTDSIRNKLQFHTIPAELIFN